MPIRTLKERFSVWLHTRPQVRGCAWSPAVDVYLQPAGWLLKFELAGVRPEDVEVGIRGTCLTVMGVRRDFAVGANRRAQLLEIAYDRFERSVELGEALDRATLAIEYRDGMLLVQVTHGSR